MKGSVKVKFDFGWAMSLIMAIVLSVGAVARLSFTYSVQTKANEICKVTSKHAANASEVFTYEDFYISCKTLELKPNLQVMMDLDKWTYEEVYPNHNIFTLGYGKK